MAIVINGSGTVTGISVGGLPDGIVDAGTLATNSVDSAELIDGAVDNSHMAAMAASKLTGALPAISGASLTGITTGKVLQVVNGSTNTLVSNTTATPADTGLTAAITPSATSSKNLILVNQNGVFKSSDYVHNDIRLDLVRASSSISMISKFAVYTGTTIQLYAGTLSTSWLDSPSTTSATTYKTQFHNQDGGGSGGDVSMQKGAAVSTITLIEIGA